ncbi:MAG TPA: DUF475 domain-containing protein [Arenimonas sp.]|nr:DUF475 domain-containing protein [Arenimonas sp.]
MLKDFRFSLVVTFVGLILAFAWGFNKGGLSTAVAALTIAAILGVMEVSLSFDNAVVNAGVLKDMDEKWQQIFLTVGILIAVFGMRLIFPLLIVAIATSQGMIEVAQMAITNPDEYAGHLTDAHVGIAAFGGMFLLLVFLNFMFDEEKELHWLGYIERKLSNLGKLDMVTVLVPISVLLSFQMFLPESDRLTAMLAGTGGILLYIAVDSLSSLFDEGSKDNVELVSDSIKRNGLMAFIYLEILDASFSFDGVIGAFAITRDVIIIMIGLMIGAMFVRSLTVYLVKKGTLDEYVFLEHGAHYAIGVLAFIMLTSMMHHVSEVFTGLVGVAFIVVAVISSIKYKKNNSDLVV